MPSCKTKPEGAHYIAVKDKDNKYKHFKVPYEVYLYVRQLEAYIIHPEESKLKEFYSDRFGNGLYSERCRNERRFK